MPKSKRAQKVSLTETRKKGIELKKKVVEEVREHVDSYARVFVFSAHNMRNAKLKEIRQEWKHSRFHFGKNKVLALALGHDAADEYRDNLHKISRRLYGQMGLLFTNKTKQEVLDFFSRYSDKDFARSGNVATQTVVIDAGPLTAFSHSMEPQLRQIGLPTSLQKGVIVMKADYKVCEKGRTLTPEQARILKLFGHMMADFKLTIESMWQNDGSFEVFDVSAIDPFDAGKIRLRSRTKGPEEADIPDEDMGFEAVVDSDGEEEAEDKEQALKSGSSLNKTKSKDSGLDEPSSSDSEADIADEEGEEEEDQ